ncbi:hypothetical protein B0H14DRAFT_3899074 [Mycena olivaceomarginata]|nr:hypothetical protein B0H14DRAFT_3899074 [Mycena olivaceomarginata]
MHSFPSDARLHRFRMSRRRARRVYWPLHGAAVRRRRGDQRWLPRRLFHSHHHPRHSPPPRCPSRGAYPNPNPNLALLLLIIPLPFVLFAGHSSANEFCSVSSSSTRSLVSRDIESCPSLGRSSSQPLCPSPPALFQPPSLTLSPLPPCSTRLVRCRLHAPQSFLSSTIAVSPTHLTMSLPMHIIWNPDIHEFARSKTSADPAVDLPAWKCFYFHAAGC